jgi:hypothetical protein
MIRQFRSILVFGLIALFSSQVLAADLEQPDSATSESNTDTIWVWADSEDKNNPIFLTRGSDDEWQEPTAISDNEKINVVPAVTTYPNGDLFVIWTAYNNGQSQLLFKSQKDGIWTDEKEYYSGLESNTAPSAAIDKDGTIWVAWAGFNGLNDEIYTTTSVGTEFETATPLTNNDVPDIHPIMGINSESGFPWILWHQFTETGYVEFQSTWNGSEWSEPQQTESTENEGVVEESDIKKERSALVKKTVLMPDSEESNQETADIVIPQVVTDPESAAMHQPGNEVQSLPVRAMTPVE